MLPLPLLFQLTGESVEGGMHIYNYKLLIKNGLFPNITYNVFLDFKADKTPKMQNHLVFLLFANNENI